MTRIVVALFALLLLTAAGGRSANACSIEYPQRPGETQRQAMDRLGRESQTAAWRRSPSVFLARIGPYDWESFVVNPVVALKGQPTRPFVSKMSKNGGADCGIFVPRRALAIVFVPEIGPDRRPVHRDGWRRLQIVYPEEVRSRTLADALEKEVGRMGRWDGVLGFFGIFRQPLVHGVAARTDNQ